MSVLCGEDFIVDVGTESGKTLCFSLPLILHDTNIVLTISPLTAFMIDQVHVEYFWDITSHRSCYAKAQDTPVPTVAVCAEALLHVGGEKLYAVSESQNEKTRTRCNTSTTRANPCHVRATQNSHIEPSRSSKLPSLCCQVSSTSRSTHQYPLPDSYFLW